MWVMLAPGKGLGGRDLGSGREALGEEVGEHRLPAAELSWQCWKRCCQLKKFIPVHSRNFPGWDVMGIAPKFWNVCVCSCSNSRERGKSGGWRSIFQR